MTIHRAVHHWFADKDGSADVPLVDSLGNGAVGILYRVTTAPVLGNAPTVNYDVYLMSRFGVDVADGLAINRSASAVETVYLYHSAATTGRFQRAAARDITIQIRNAGAGTSGTIAIFWVL